MNLKELSKNLTLEQKLEFSSRLRKIETVGDTIKETTNLLTLAGCSPVDAYNEAKLSLTTYTKAGLSPGNVFVIIYNQLFVLLASIDREALQKLVNILELYKSIIVQYELLGDTISGGQDSDISGQDTVKSESGSNVPNGEAG